MRGTAAPPESPSGRASESLAVYFVVGIALGVLFMKTEVASWFRIQEMFRFQSVHMYGVIGLAVAVGAVTTSIMKARGVRTIRGDEIAWPDRGAARPRKHHILGGTVFGLGWALVGACPGPLFALTGAGYPAFALGLLAAIAGAWTYGLVKPRLPH